MDENQKEIAIGIGLMLIPIIVLITLFSGKTSKKLSVLNKKKYYHKTKKNIVKHKTRDNKRGSVHTRSANCYRKASIRSPFSAKQREIMKKRHEKALSELEKAQKNWLLAKVNNDKLDEKTRQKYRFRLIKSYPIAIDAYKNKDYKKALKEFKKAIDDPLASPVTKYFCYRYMQVAAQKMGNFDLYIMLASKRAELIAKEDLTVLGISKTKKMIEWVKNFKRIVEAGNDPKKYDLLIRERMLLHMLPDNKRAGTEAILNKEIASYRDHFKEFFKNAI